MMTSSLSLRRKLSEVKSLPITGTSLSHGILLTSRVTLFCSRPPMTKLWPLATSIMVSALRVVSAGTEMFWSVIAPVVVSWLTSE